MINNRMNQIQIPALVGYFVAGYPSQKQHIDFLQQSCAHGVDILEIGFPAKDPSLDGDVIQRAQEAIDPALATDTAYFCAIRDAVKAPVWLMGYYDDLVTTGAYLSLAKAGAYDALVVADTTNQVRQKLAKDLEPHGVSVVGMIHPQSSEAELADCFGHFPLIYQQLYCGVTGVAHANDDYLPLLQKARHACDAKIFAGFGIATPKRAQSLIAHGFDGVIVGSILMKHLMDDPQTLFPFIQDINSAIKDV